MPKDEVAGELVAVEDPMDAAAGEAHGHRSVPELRAECETIWDDDGSEYKGEVSRQDVLELIEVAEAANELAAFYWTYVPHWTRLREALARLDFGDSPSSAGGEAEGIRSGPASASREEKA